MSAMYWLALFFAVHPHAEEANHAANEYCKPPEFHSQGKGLQWVKLNLKEIKLLNPEEEKDPDAERKLATTPGPYGHSELGFRYLSRMFGYPGPFNGTADEVEAWLLEKESEHRPVLTGYHELWEKWVVTPKKRLSVPRGAADDIPRKHAVNAHFRDGYDRLAHAQCIKSDIELKLCNNYKNDGQPIGYDDFVYFTDTPFNRSRPFCKVTLTTFRKQETAKRRGQHLGNLHNNNGLIGGSSAK